MFRSGATDAVFRSTDTLIVRVKGRDFVLSAALGTIFGALSGAAMGVVAMLGRSLLPQGVMGFILLGIATPSESAASGVVGALLAAAYYRKLSFRMILESV
ncbi:MULTISPECIES: hypothetical protein [unclassified Halomonas]|uniref:hypothetical protein n=1 Tax=unclassified Halomonas TaxID=2609666 RepID=UPI001F3AF01C|nr:MULTISPECIES: hypothetical protein [unclassified Halomonas]